MAGLNVFRLLQNRETLIFPATTALGALARHLEGSPSIDFQPMNINFGLIPPLEQKIKNRKERNKKIAERALVDLAEFIKDTGINRSNV